MGEKGEQPVPIDPKDPTIVMNGHYDEIIHIAPPLADRRTYRTFLKIGLIGLLASVVMVSIYWFVMAQYIQVSLSEPSLETLYAYSRLLNLIRTPEFLISCLLAIGFYGVLAKSGNRYGILFVPIYLIPANSVIPWFIGFLGILIHPTDFTFIVIQGSVILGLNLILANILWKSRSYVGDKRIFIVVIALFLIVPLATHVWAFLSNGLNLTNSFASIMLYWGPSIVFFFVNSIALAALFIIELRTEL